MLDPAALAALGDLELVSRRIVDGTLVGLHRSPFHGYSAEFSQYRHYRPGDDVKYVDWKLFARTDRLYTKQFRETTNLHAQLALDASASMNFAGRHGLTKFEYARLLVAGLAHLLVRQGDAAGLTTFADGIRDYLPPRGGRTHLRNLLLALARSEPGGSTDAAAALARSIDLLRRRGLFAVASDLYDESRDVERALARAAQAGHEVAVFHVLTPEEIDLPYSGDVEFEDLETGAVLLASPRTIAADYRRDLSAFAERWRERCAVLGIGYQRVSTHDPVEQVLRTYLRGRTAAPGDR
jgi:uncharacterized protein (DUF58 family)